MAASMKRKLIKTALVSRLIVILLQIILNNIIPDHNADAFKYRSSQQSSLADHVIQFLLEGFAKWDGAHFLSIAEKGYTEERQYAFFPLLPVMISALANTILIPLRLIVNLNSCLLIAAAGINIISFILATCGFYKLSEHVLKDRRLAYNTTLLFCINPASVFFSSVYTESLFAAFTFHGMLFLEQGFYAKSAFTFALSTLTRSNGLVSCGFIIYKVFKETVSYLTVRQDSSTFKSIALCCTNGLNILLTALLIVSPFAIYQLYSYATLCTEYTTFFAYLSGYISGETSHLTDDASPWCYDKLPLLYSYVQNHYWDVGFLKYYQIRKMPNFILALPMIIICVCAIWNYCIENWNSVKYLGLLEKTKHSAVGYFSQEVFVYVVHMMTLLVFATTCINIEVITRLICSCCPVFYWYVASVIKTKGSSKQKYFKFDGDKNFISTFYHYFDIDDQKTKLILMYFLSYSGFGILLHCNFLPWT